MRPIKSCVKSVKGLRKNHDVTHIGLTDYRQSINRFKVASDRKSNSHTESGIDAIGNEVLVTDCRDSRILDTIFLIDCKFALAGWLHERLGICTKCVTIIASCDANNRSPVAQVRTKQQDVLVVKLRCCRVVNCFHGIGNIMLREDWITLVARHQWLIDHRVLARSEFVRKREYSRVPYVCS